MVTLDTWLATHGPMLALALEARRDIICETVSGRLAAAYPALCYDPKRFDAETFQQITFDKSPGRFHKVLVAALRFNSLAMIEREYQWSWKVLPRYGVTAQHLLAQVRWYFEIARVHVATQLGDIGPLHQIEAAVLSAVERVTREPLPAHNGTVLGRIGPRGRDPIGSA
jgi:hypothetical protein